MLIIQMHMLGHILKMVSIQLVWSVFRITKANIWVKILGNIPLLSNCFLKDDKWLGKLHTHIEEQNFIVLTHPNTRIDQT